MSENRLREPYEPPSWLRRTFLRASLKLGFRQVYADLSSLSEIEGAPALLLPNHLCGWDASIAMLVTDSVGRRLRMAAAERVVDAWPILRRVGIFPVERGATLRSAQMLRALGQDLNGADDIALWFFTQGCHVREGLVLEPERGALVVAKAAPRAQVIPVALHYELLEGRKATAWVKTLPPLRKEQSQIPLAEMIISATEALAADLRTGTSSYKPLLHPDRHTVLLRNVPCNVRLVDKALRKGGFDLTFHTALQLPTEELERLRPQLATAVLNYVGPLYGELVDQALEQNIGEPVI
ncbi:MAG TPA: 1-acyl-sn-glycerol-3-phosphate acyltransferase [Solirubrobacterales bacterium]|nr:1-acyl-sn-glycerol-3-phosphate acyltransferase [Solirubrobacterales bacterium]